QVAELAGHVDAHAVADPLELQPLAAGPPAGPPGAADDRPVVRLLPAARDVGQRPGPRLPALERVVDDDRRVLAEVGAGGVPLLLAAGRLLRRAVGEFLGREELVGPAGDGVQHAGPVEP